MRKTINFGPCEDNTIPLSFTFITAFFSFVKMIGICSSKRTRDEDDDGLQLKRRSNPSGPSIHDFTLKAFTSQYGTVDVQLSKLLHEFRYVVLFCYSNDFTPQACQDLKSIEENAQTFLNLQTAPLAMSTDHPHVHDAFVRFPAGLGFKPRFPLLSDSVRLLSNHLGTADRDNGCSKRAVFVLDQSRKVRYSIVLHGNQPFPMETIIVKVHFFHFSFFPYSRCYGKN
ncbi:hypothetical protein BJV82DRAFT_169993 [Fennellomyces sp. T-0311]|nr:hypothetical protein BJV82DRAFT_169993 [Fennellomyces sp. T-0311]